MERARAALRHDGLLALLLVECGDVGGDDSDADDDGSGGDRTATAPVELAADGADLPFAGEVEAYIRAALRKKNPDRPLDTNVEFFTAILLDALAIPRQAFTPIFAVARSAGWTAHAREQQRARRIGIRRLAVVRAAVRACRLAKPPQG